MMFVLYPIYGAKLANSFLCLQQLLVFYGTVYSGWVPHSHTLMAMQHTCDQKFLVHDVLQKLTLATVHRWSLFILVL